MLDLDAAATWIDERLDSAGISRRGPLESVRVRPWGEVAKAETDRGPVWLKAPGPTTAFEVPLYDLLARRVPSLILVPLATDAERGWVLLPEGGQPVGESASGEQLMVALADALKRYAGLQRELTSDAEELLAIGVEDMRPAAMSARFDEAAEAAARYVTEHGTDGDRALLDRVHARREDFAALCAELADRPGGASLDHNDLHPWNILGRPGDPATLRFYDWGDSVVAHPFAAMLVPLGFAARDSEAALARARDAYLSAYEDLGSHGELVDTLELACRVAKVARALTWERALRTASNESEVDPEFVRAPFATLASLLDDSYLGGA